MPVRASRRLSWVVGIAFALAGPSVGYLTTRLASGWERERAYRAAADHFATRRTALAREVDETTEELSDLAVLFRVDPRVSRGQFALFSSEILARHPAITALEWAPRVPPGTRAAHERGAQADGLADYRIREVSGGRTTVAPSGVLDRYPVYYVQPLGPNREALGLDLASEPARRAALLRAEATGEMALTDPIDLVQGVGDGKGFLALLPVRGAGPAGAWAGRTPDGFVVLVARARTLFREVLDGEGERPSGGMRYELFDTNVGGRPMRLDTAGDTGPVYDGWRFEHQLGIGGREWKLVGRPTTAYVSRYLTRGPLVLGLGVVLVWGLVGGLALLLVARGRTTAARRQAQVFEAALRNLSEGVVVADASGRFVLFNEAAERLLGMAPRDMAPSDWSSTYGCFYPDGVTPFPSDRLPLARALRGELSAADVFIRNPNVPQGVWINISGTPLRDGQGAPDGGIVVFRDVTAQMRQQAELARLSNAVEQTADGIMMTTPEGVIEYVNPAFETITGYSRAEAVGQTPRLLRSGRQAPDYYEALWRTILAGEVFRGSPVNRRKNGELYRAEQTITPIKDAEGRIEHFVSVIKDMTERLQAEQQAIEMQYASAVQRRLYPASSPTVSGLDVAAATFPALATCGDYFDYLALPDGSLGVVIGDVSGHGLGPAMIMVETRAHVQACARSCANPGEVLTRIGETLYRDLDDERYVALIMARIDPVARRVTYSNAGHVSAYHLGARGEVKAVMESCGPPAGMLPGVRYGVVENPPLEEGDVVVFLTDGVTETEDASGNCFGADAALDEIRAHMDEPACRLVQRVRDAARRFAGDAPQADDITLVVCRTVGRAEVAGVADASPAMATAQPAGSSV